MKDVVIHVVSDDAIEIMMPAGREGRSRCSVVCLCCQRADQPMDDDGCGICDACLGLPVRATDDPNGLEFPAPSSRPSFTARDR